MHEIYLVSSVHISLPIPLNEVNREWAKGTDDERSGSGMVSEPTWRERDEPREVEIIGFFVVMSFPSHLVTRPTAGPSGVRDEKGRERHGREVNEWILVFTHLTFSSPPCRVPTPLPPTRPEGHDTRGECRVMWQES